MEVISDTIVLLNASFALTLGLKHMAPYDLTARELA